MPNRPVDSRRIGLLSYVLVVVGLALSAAFVASMTGRAFDTPSPEETTRDAPIAYDMLIPPTDEGRARYGNIFVGEVLKASGEDIISSTDPQDKLRAILYDVEVEQTLQGDASGRVTIWYEGADYRGPDSGGSGYVHEGELKVGERYLFFAGFNDIKNWYPVNATYGVIPVEDDRRAAELVGAFEPLIREAEQLAQQEARAVDEIDRCEHPTQSPTISVEPVRGATGDKVRVTGTGFIRPQVSIWWDGMKEKLTSTSVELSCEITKGVTIPKAVPGKHRIVVQDAGGNTAEATFEVVEK